MYDVWWREKLCLWRKKTATCVHSARERECFPNVHMKNDFTLFCHSFLLGDTEYIHFERMSNEQKFQISYVFYYQHAQILFGDKRKTHLTHRRDEEKIDMLITFVTSEKYRCGRGSDSSKIMCLVFTCCVYIVRERQKKNDGKRWSDEYNEIDRLTLTMYLSL